MQKNDQKSTMFLAFHVRTECAQHITYFCLLCSRLAIKQIGNSAWPGRPSTGGASSLCVLTVVTGQSAGEREEASLPVLDLLSPSNFRKTQRGWECSWTMRKAQWLFTTQRQRPTFTLTVVTASRNHCIHTSTPVTMTMGRTLPLWLSVLSSREWLQQCRSKPF